jgi:CRP-like cAMP-binding protein
VYHQGDPADTVHLLDKGKVAIRVATPQGDIATLQVLPPGAVFGELALLAPTPRRDASAVALEPTETLALDQDVFAELRRAFSCVNRSLIDTLAASVTRLAAERLEAHYIPAETRVLRRLVELTELYGGCVTGTVVRVRQEELAALAGTSRATVNRVLGEAVDAGAISLARLRIEIRDPDILRRGAR